MKKYFKNICPWIGLYFVIVWIPNVDNKVIWTVLIWQILKCQNVTTQSTINSFHGNTLWNIKYNAAKPTFLAKHMVVYGFRKFNIMECFQVELEIPIELGRAFWGELGPTLGYTLALFEKRFFSFLSVTWLPHGQPWVILEGTASLIQWYLLCLCHVLTT